MLKAICQNENVICFEDVRQHMQNRLTEDFIWIPNVINIIKLVAFNPASSSTAWRKFSLARNLNGQLRSTMLPARFNSLELLKFQRVKWQTECTKRCKRVCQQENSAKPIWTFHWQRFLTLVFKDKKPFCPEHFIEDVP